MSKKTKISLIREIRSRKSPHFYSFHAPKAKKSHFYIKKTSKNLHVSQKKHNFAAEYRVNWLHDRRIIAPAIHVRRVGKRERKKILVHFINISNFKKINYGQESIENVRGSRSGDCRP